MVAPVTQPTLQQTAAAAQAMRTLAAQLTAPAPAPAKPVAMRGGIVLAAVQRTTKPYRVAAPHNAAWWATLAQVLAQHNGTAPVPAVLAAGLPATHITYLVRRGYLQGA